MVEIQIKNVTKKYRKKPALKNININIKEGIFGLLGSNGAGKTTLIKCLVGLLKYQGQIDFQLDGNNQNESIKIGYLIYTFSNRGLNLLNHYC